MTNTSLEPSAVHAVEIPDSRGGPTLAVTVTPADGTMPGMAPRRTVICGFGIALSRVDGDLGRSSFRDLEFGSERNEASPRCLCLI